jgi:hypothetical protein
MPKQMSSRALQAYADALCEGDSENNWEHAKVVADVAFKANMPRMDSLLHIREYVSCVAQGVVCGVFTGAEASKLLYAAQVSLSTFTQEAKRCKVRKIRKVA